MHLLTIGLLGAAVCLVAQIVHDEIRYRRLRREAQTGSRLQIERVMDTYRTAPRGALTQEQVNEIVREWEARHAR